MSTELDLRRQTGAISNTVIYLVGATGVGKMTIGKHLAHALNAPLIHNHLWLNPIFGVIEQDGVTPLPAEVWPLTTQVSQGCISGSIEPYTPIVESDFHACGGRAGRGR